MKPIWALMRRDLTLAMRRSGDWLQPVLFFLLVVCLFPFAVSPSPAILQQLAPGIIWVAALLSALLGLERLFRDDVADGSMQQLQLSGCPMSLLVAAKITVHWLLSIVPLLLISPVLAILLNMTQVTYIALLLTLLLGTPILSLVGAVGVALTMGSRGGSALVSVLMLPFFIPVLIFAIAAVNAAAMQQSYVGQLALLGALLLLAIVSAPVAAAAALKVSQH